MNWNKKRIFAAIVGLGLGAIFFTYFVEYNFGYKYPSDKQCILPQGYTRVYVHWLAPLNNTYATFCNAETTPLHHRGKKQEQYRCDCK